MGHNFPTTSCAHASGCSCDVTIFKAVFPARDETRLFIIPSAQVCIATVQDRISTLFAVDRLKLTFVDEEGDIAAIVSDEDLNMARRISALQARPSVRLVVSIEQEVSAEKQTAGGEPDNSNQPAIPDEAQGVTEDALAASSAKPERVQRQKLTKEQRQEMKANIEQLQAMGYEQKGVCKRLLLKHEGQMPRVVEELQTMAAAREAKQCQKHARVPRDGSLTSEARQQRVAERRAARLESQQQAKDKRIARRAQRDNARVEVAASHEDAPASGRRDEEASVMNQQVEELMKMGFTRKCQCLRLLKKHQGDVNKAAEDLRNREEKRLARRREKASQQGLEAVKR